MSNLKKTIAKQRLKLTAATLRVYNEKYLKGEVATPMDVLEEVMLNAERDSDRIKAAQEIIRMCYQSPPRESEVQLTEEVSGSTEHRDELRQMLKDLDLTKVIPNEE